MYKKMNICYKCGEYKKVKKIDCARSTLFYIDILNNVSFYKNVCEDCHKVLKMEKEINLIKTEKELRKIKLIKQKKWIKHRDKILEKERE